MHLGMDEMRRKDSPFPKVKCEPIRGNRVPKMGDKWGGGSKGN